MNESQQHFFKLLFPYGVMVFNEDEGMYTRWLSKSNLSLGGKKPIDLLHTLSGYAEVRGCLDRIEYGNTA